METPIPDHSFPKGHGPVGVPELRSVTVDGQRLRVGIRPGDGVPLLLVMGIGGNLDMWEPFVAALPVRLEIITFDAPGTGESLDWRRPRRMPALASLIDGLLDALGYNEVDVLGVSFGGALAQQLARTAPRRVRRLVLAATMPGLGGVPGNPMVLLSLATPRRFRSMDDFRAVAATLYGGRIRREPQLFRQQAYARLARPPSPSGYYAQLYAVSGWTSMPWLHRLHQPTLVLAGDDDPIVPLISGRILAARIPQARLHVVSGGGHLFLLEDAAYVAPLVAEFLGMD